MKMRATITFEYELPGEAKGAIVENYREDHGRDADPEDDVFEADEQQYFDDDPDGYIQERLLDNNKAPLFTLDYSEIKVEVLSRK